MPDIASKEKYWEKRAKNNPFEDPSRRGYKPGFYENRPDRRVLFLYIPLIIGSWAFGRWYKKRQDIQGISLPYYEWMEKPIGSGSD